MATATTSSAPASSRSVSSARVRSSTTRAPATRSPAFSSRPTPPVTSPPARRVAALTAATWTTPSSVGTPARCATSHWARRPTAFSTCTPSSRSAASASPPTRRSAAGPAYRLETSYRFRRHGSRTGRQDATLADADGGLATLTYGDSATVRITNVGRLRAKDNEPPGYWLDPADGRWLNERDASDASGDSSEMPVVDADGKEKRRKKRVIPFVEDRRNILVLTLDRPLPEPVALTLMYALERGIETAFELEDSELTSELLPCGRRPARPAAVHRGGGGRRRCPAPPPGRTGRPRGGRPAGSGPLPLRRAR